MKALSSSREGGAHGHLFQAVGEGASLAQVLKLTHAIVIGGCGHKGLPGASFQSLARGLSRTMRGFMKTPPGLQPLIDDGVIDEVLRSLKCGKEATVYTRAHAARRCAAPRSIATWASAASRSARSTRRAARCAAAGRRAPWRKSTRFGRKEAEIRLEEHRGGRAVQAGRGRRARAAPLRLFQRHAGHGAGDGCRGRAGAAARRGGPHCPNSRANTTTFLVQPGRAHAEHRADPRRSCRSSTCWWRRTAR